LNILSQLNCLPRYESENTVAARACPEISSALANAQSNNGNSACRGSSRDDRFQNLEFSRALIDSGCENHLAVARAIPNFSAKKEALGLQPNAPDSTVLVVYFSSCRRRVASPFFSAAPAVLAPWVLASFDDAWSRPCSVCATGGALLCVVGALLVGPVRSGFALA